MDRETEKAGGGDEIEEMVVKAELAGDGNSPEGDAEEWPWPDLRGDFHELRKEEGILHETRRKFDHGIAQKEDFSQYEELVTDLRKALASLNWIDDDDLVLLHAGRTIKDTSYQLLYSELAKCEQAFSEIKGNAYGGVFVSAVWNENRLNAIHEAKKTALGSYLDDLLAQLQKIADKVWEFLNEYSRDRESWNKLDFSTEMPEIKPFQWRKFFGKHLRGMLGLPSDGYPRTRREE